MSYNTVDFLYTNGTFRGRIRACTVEQGDYFINDTRGDIKALAESLLRGDATVLEAFYRITCSAPGMADAAEVDGQVDQSNITDQAILSAVQGSFPQVATLYFNEDGTPIPPVVV